MHLVLYSSQFPTPRDPNGGIFTAQLAEALAKRVQLTVVCPVPWCPNLPLLRNLGTCKWYAGIPHQVSRNGISVHYVRYPFIPKISSLIQPWFQAPTALRLLRRLHRENPISAINAHWMYPDAIAATWCASKIGCPILLTALGSDINVASEHPVRARQIRWALRKAQAVSGVSRALVNKLGEFGAQSEQRYFIPNGVNTQQFFPASAQEVRLLRAKLSLDLNRRYLLFVGRLHPVKGLNHLIDALAQLKSDNKLDFDTILVGGGDLRASLEESIQRLGLTGRVRLAGEVAHKNVPDWLRAVDAFCLPSLMEGMPNVVLEALACGLPTIASSVGALPDIINPSNGILVEPGNSAKLAEGLHHLMSRAWDREIIINSPMAASWDKVAEQYLAVINSMTDRVALAAN